MTELKIKSTDAEALLLLLFRLRLKLITQTDNINSWINTHTMTQSTNSDMFTLLIQSVQKVGTSTCRYMYIHPYIALRGNFLVLYSNSKNSPSFAKTVWNNEQVSSGKTVKPTNNNLECDDPYTRRCLDVITQRKSESGRFIDRKTCWITNLIKSEFKKIKYDWFFHFPC